MTRRGAHTREWLGNGHPFMWLLLVGLLPATVAANTAAERTPGYALNSEWVYRGEIGLAFFAGIYILALLLWLAYQGRAVTRMELAGTGVETPDPALDEAAEGFDDFRTETEERLDAHDDAVEDIDSRVANLEALPRFRDRLRWVMFGS